MKYFVSVLLLAVLASCNLTKFDHYPGVAQKEFPTTLQGTYQLVLPQGFSLLNKTKPGDTLLLKIGKNFTNDLTGNAEQKKLDSTYVLSWVNQKYHVLSLKDETHIDYWNCFVLIPQKGNLRLYPVTDAADKRTQKKYFNGHFIELKNETDTIFAYSQHDSAFVRYFEKELKQQDGIKFTRLIPAKVGVKK
jgi:hypothetical protein